MRGFGSDGLGTSRRRTLEKLRKLLGTRAEANAALKEAPGVLPEPEPEELLRLSLMVEERLAETGFKQRLRAFLAEEASEALRRFKEEKQVEVATKTGKERGRAARDALGRRVHKPFASDGHQAEHDEEGPRRDGSGRRRNKPFDPRRTRR